MHPLRILHTTLFICFDCGRSSVLDCNRTLLEIVGKRSSFIWSLFSGETVHAIYAFVDMYQTHVFKLMNGTELGYLIVTPNPAYNRI